MNPHDIQTQDVSSVYFFDPITRVSNIRYFNAQQAIVHYKSILLWRVMGYIQNMEDLEWTWMVDNARVRVIKVGSGCFACIGSRVTMQERHPSLSHGSISSTRWEPHAGNYI